MEDCGTGHMNWSVYIILCSDNSLYTGITTDTERRLYQHANGRGARYFRGRRPVKLVYRENGHTRSTAGKREAAIKSMKPADKFSLIASERNEIRETVTKRKIRGGGVCICENKRLPNRSWAPSLS